MMTTPNHGGYTESADKIALRWERMKAEALAAELKPQMDEFLNAVGWALDALNMLLNNDERAQQAREATQ